MDDSDQDFVDLCSKLLKRVRRKPGEPRPPRKAEHQPSSQASEGCKRRKNAKKDADPGSKVAGSQSVCTGAGQLAVSGGTGRGDHAGDAWSSAVSAAPGPGPGPGPGPRAEGSLAPKDKVLLRMQQFKRASPQRMVHRDKSRPTNQDPDPQPQRQDPPETCSSGLQLDSDEALALRLQQELDREAAAAAAEAVDLEDVGLFFCQICHRDLSHMTPEGRTQHLNRCLDDSEESTSAPPPPPPPSGIPDCPICGKKFKSQKSRSAHLKRCSSDMGVSPAVLLQALQRQAEETQPVPAANALVQTGGTKRKKESSKPGLPARKKPRKKAGPLDEDAMVALALSSSLLERERELGTEAAASHPSKTAALRWKPDAGKGRRKKKKDAAPRPPPLLLVQDAEAALQRLQERVSALLLRSRAPSPPTPTRSPSSVRGWSGAAPLWQRSTLLNASSTCLSDFYTPELGEFIVPWEPAKTDEASSNESSLQQLTEAAPLTGTRASVLPSSPAPSASVSGQLPVGSQALQDLMELAEDGMTLTQCGYTTSGPNRNRRSSAPPWTNLHLSDFVPEEAEERADLHVSGFLPETAHVISEDPDSPERRKSDPAGADEERGGHRSAALSRLASDLSGMVNNPQLSDVQLQVDSGEVYFAHSFMAYARCPLLAEMVHESGFGVREEGAPAAHRVLISDVPGQAVLALLQYLYMARCSVSAALRPHVLELASRFDLQELRRLCELQREEAPTWRDEASHVSQDVNVNDQTDRAFMELLRSMWNEGDGGDEGVDADGGRDEEPGAGGEHPIHDVTSGEREICEEQVNEEELEEIYEFAATQRKRGEEKDSVEEEEEEEEEKVDDGEDEEFTKLREPLVKTLKPNSHLEPDPSLHPSCSRLSSSSSSSSSASTSAPPKRRTSQSQGEGFSSHKPSCLLSGRTLLQSSPSVADDFSPSPPPSTSNLPLAGLSPGQVGDWGGGGDDEEDAAELGPPLKRESRGPRSICVPVSPDLSPMRKEPELIVLSDSSEEPELGADLGPRGPSPPSPCAVQNPHSYTSIRPRSVPKPTGPTMDSKVSSTVEFSPGDPSAGSVPSHPGSGHGQSPADCSPEVSWLIPSTPVQPGRCTRTSSTQTKSSMCRTHLFPGGDTTPPSSLFSPAALPLRHELQVSSAARAGSAERRVPKSKLDERVPCSSSLDLTVSPKRPTSCDASENSEPSAVCRPVQASPLEDTPRHTQPPPHSSTPLHEDLRWPPVLLEASPLRNDLDGENSAGRGRDRTPPESPEKTELASFYLSPSPDPSNPSTSSSHRGLQSSQRHGESAGEGSHSVVESSGLRNMGAELEGQNKHTCDDGEAEVTERSFQLSFTDEPPIAFNDSWGLDAGVEVNPGCFSLRLEDSGGLDRPEDVQGQGGAAGSSPSPDRRPPPPRRSVQPSSPSTQPCASTQAPPLSFTPSPPGATNSPLESKMWDSWEEEDEEALPLSQRVNPSAHLKTPASSRNKPRRSLMPITPMPHYSDMDTPELKNKLNRFGVRPLPKRQMILKLREIHQYTHQLVSSDSEDEAPPAGSAARAKPTAGGDGPVSGAQAARFKAPRAPAAVSPPKRTGEGEAELLSASQGSNTSSAAASDESERSNPELCLSSSGDSDSDVSASQAATRLQDRLKAVSAFILSDPGLYSQILQYRPLVLSQLQERLKAAGIRLGAAKLVDYLDSQCITFTTAKPGRAAPGRRRGGRTGRGAKAAGERGASKRKAVVL